MPLGWWSRLIIRANELSRATRTSLVVCLRPLPGVIRRKWARRQEKREEERERERQAETANELKFRLSDRHPLVNVARRNNFNACGVTSFFHTTFYKPLFVKEVGPLHLEVADVIDCK